MPRRWPTVRRTSVPPCPGCHGLLDSLLLDTTWTVAPLVSHFLLYLNRHTFGESEGELLAREIRSAWDAKLNIVLLHEKDPARGGCEFNTFFLTTPHNLIEEGLYRQQLATPFEADEAHRKVSRSLLAKALGAKVSVLRGMDTLQNVSVQRKLTQRSSSMRSSSRNTTKQGS
eukprot:4448524-Prymnesium_polylepis.2